jgi:hypothetical protein
LLLVSVSSSVTPEANFFRRVAYEGSAWQTHVTRQRFPRAARRDKKGSDDEHPIGIRIEGQQPPIAIGTVINLSGSGMSPIFPQVAKSPTGCPRQPARQAR